ncbi:MAG: GSU2403 family nucleotidyltransferase fold protein [Pseudomonadota bacterium]
MLASLTSKQLTQYIDSEAVFTALEEARDAAKPFVGTLFWREVKGHHYLVRAVTANQQKSLGAKSPQNANAVDKFSQAKGEAESRVKSLTAQLAVHQKINKALRVGRAPSILIDTLNVIKDAGLEEHFVVIGTHALYAYETAASVRIPNDALATQDIDLLFDTRKRVKFFSTLKTMDVSFLAVLQRADKTFRMRDDQLYTAVNDKGFEVDVVRRMAGNDDPHPLRLSDHEDDFWAVQIETGNKLLGARPFTQTIVSSTGTMARMNTVHPLDFARIKQALGASHSRETTKAQKDLLQAKIVRDLVREHLPHLWDQTRENHETEESKAGLKGLYSGKILDISDGLVTQRISRDGTTVVHKMSALTSAVVSGQIADITYADGVGVVWNKGTSRERGT